MKNILVSLIATMLVINLSFAQEVDYCLRPDTLPRLQLQKMDYMKSGWEMMSGQMYMQLKETDEVVLPEKKIGQLPELNLKLYFKEEVGEIDYLTFYSTANNKRILFAVPVRYLKAESIQLFHPDPAIAPSIIVLIYAAGYGSKEGEFKEMVYELWDVKSFVRLAKYSTDVYESVNNEAPDGSFAKSREYSYYVKATFTGSEIIFGEANVVDREINYSNNTEDEEKEEVKTTCDGADYKLQDGWFVKQ